MTIRSNGALCPVCSRGQLCRLAKPARDYITGKDFLLDQCSRCSTSFTVVDDSASLPKSYGSNYYNSEKGKFSRLFEKFFLWNHRRNAKNIFRRWRPASVLEVGCGRAYLLGELQKLGVQVAGLESKNAPEWILKNQEVNIHSLADDQGGIWPFSPLAFQCIVYWHVLEHIGDPSFSLAQAHRALAADGVLCISVPNISSLQAQMGLTSWFHLDVPRHLCHFSREGLVELLRKSGFEVIASQPGDVTQNLYGWWQSMANLFTPSRANGFYRLLQGGQPLRSASLPTVLVQVLSAPLWLPLGLLAYALESLSGRHGTITLYARKAA